MTNHLTLFQAHRARVFAVAYRMLGSRAEAEDMVQEAYLRFREADAGTLRSPEAWLVTVTTRLSIDRLRAAQAERASYVGEWLPEPLLAPRADTPEAAAEHAGEVSMALLVVLERLAPEERAAFLLRQVFDHDYPEVAAILGKSEDACRQLVHRAKARVQREQPRFQVSADRHRQVLEKFVKAAQSGEHREIMALLGDEVQLVGDGGGKVASVFHPLHGADRVARLYQAVARRLGPRLRHEIATLNGQPGLLRYLDGELESAQSFVIDGERGIVAIYTLRNPDKLRPLARDLQNASGGLSQDGGPGRLDSVTPTLD